MNRHQYLTKQSSVVPITTHKIKQKTTQQEYWDLYEKELETDLTFDKQPTQLKLIKHNKLIYSIENRIYLQDLTTDEKKRFKKFKAVVTSISIRKDEKLVVGGDSNGYVKLFNVDTGEILRKERIHEGAVNKIEFLDFDNTRFLSCSSDNTIKLTNITTMEVEHTFEGHTDSVKSFSFYNNTFASCSYDKTFIIWDLKTKQKIQHINLNQLAEDIKYSQLKDGRIVLGLACGSSVSIYCDKTKNLITKLQNFKKNVSKIHFFTENVKSQGLGSSRYLLTSSLDGHLKVYETSTFKLICSFKHDSPILDLSVSLVDNTIAVCLAENKITIRKKKSTGDNSQKLNKVELAQIYSNSYSLFNKGRTENIFGVKTQDICKNLEFNLKKFEYHNALDTMLVEIEKRKKGDEQQANYFFTLVEELDRRGGLKTALLGRNYATLLPILIQVNRYFNKEEYIELCIKLTQIILNYYSHLLTSSKPILDLIQKIKTKLSQHLDNFQRMNNTSSVIDMIMTLKMSKQ